MGEEVKMSEYETNGNDEERVADWEFGLPTADDLTPLSQTLIPPELASAFSISPEPYRSLLEVNRETQNTLLNLRSVTGALSSNKFKSYNDDPMTAVDTEAEEINDNNNTDQEKLRRLDSGEEADSALRTENLTGGEDPATARTLKRPRLVWTPQLHKRFVDVVAYLGIKNAVPKTIMQLMNVEGLTRENVASHLQKYRLYLKRMQGLSSEAPSASDHQLFASTPVPQSLQDNSNGNGGEGNGHMGMSVPVPVPYHHHHHPGVGPMMTMPMYVGNNNNNSNNNNNHNHHHNHNPYNMIQQRDWSGNHNYQHQHM